MRTFFPTINTICLVALVYVMGGCTSHPAGEKIPQNEISKDSSNELKDTTKEITKNIAARDTSQRVNINSETHKPLTIIVKNLASPDAPVIIGVYGPLNKFLDETDQLKQYKFLPSGNQVCSQVTDLEYGELAMAFYQDVNKDGIINKNVIGMPKEPYGFSNDYRPVLKAPKFKDCEFDYSASNDTIVMSLITIK